MSELAKAAKHSAPGQYLGFALQPVRLCYHLLTCSKGAKVSLEHLDDVAIHETDGTICLEQTKSALKQNPLSDWAVDFWKALANWSSAIDDGLVEIGKSRFRIYVTPRRTGKFAQVLSDATTANEVVAILAEVANKLASARKPPACQDYLKVVLDLSQERQAAILMNMRAESEHDDPVDPIRALLAATIPPEHIDLFCQHAIGMAKEAADRLIRRGKPALLDGDTFKKSFRAFVQKNLLPGLLTSLTPPPRSDDIVTVFSMRPVFIRQLELIEVSEEERLHAVSDFLRSSADKVDWAERGLIFEGSLRDWDDDLVRRHGFVARDIADLHCNRTPEIRGRITYRQCAMLQPALEGRAVPGHFVHGCLNALANTRRIGWHPNYDSLLDVEAE